MKAILRSLSVTYGYKYLTRLVSELRLQILNSESSNNTCPTNICSNASVLFSHSDLSTTRGMRVSEERVNAVLALTAAGSLPLTS